MSARTPLPNPPRWAEILLRGLLAPRDREAVAGDLLEEYREVVVPSRGRIGARLWYLHQVLSLLTAVRIRQWIARHPFLQTTFCLLAGTGCLSFVVMLLVRSHFGPPRVPLVPVFLLLAALAAGAATGARSTADRQFWRVGLLWGGLFAAALTVRMLVDALAPSTAQDFALERARSGFSEFDYPRRWLLGVTLATALFGAGFSGAWRKRQVRAGTLTAMAASVIGFLFTMAAAFVREQLGAGADRPSIDPPWIGVVAVLAIGTLLGTIGALFGRGFRSQPAPPQSTTQ